MSDNYFRKHTKAGVKAVMVYTTSSGEIVEDERVAFTQEVKNVFKDLYEDPSFDQVSYETDRGCYSIPHDTIFEFLMSNRHTIEQLFECQDHINKD